MNRPIVEAAIIPAFGNDRPPRYHQQDRGTMARLLRSHRAKRGKYDACALTYRDGVATITSPGGTRMIIRTAPV